MVSSVGTGDAWTTRGGWSGGPGVTDAGATDANEDTIDGGVQIPANLVEPGGAALLEEAHSPGQRAAVIAVGPAAAVLVREGSQLDNELLELGLTTGDAT